MQYNLKILRAFVACFMLLASTASANEAARAFVDAHGSFMRLFSPSVSNVNVRYLTQPGNEEDDGPGEFDLQLLSVGLSVPIPISVDWMGGVNMDYEARRYNFEQVQGAATATGNESLHKVAFTGRLSYFVLPKLMTMVAVQFGIYSDLDESLESDDYKVFGRGMAVYRWKENRQFLGGLLVSEDFGDTRVIPLFGIRARSTDGRWHTSLTLPVEARLGYFTKGKSEVYGGLWLSGAQYHARLGPADTALDVKVHERRVGLGLNLLLSKKLVVNLEAGTSLGSEFEFDVPNAGQFSGGLESAPYLAIGLKGRI